MKRLATCLMLALPVLFTPAVTTAQPDDDPAVLRLAEPDFSLVSLPTALRVPAGRSAFRVTHRFLRAVNQGDFGEVAEDLFGIDAGAQTGLEFRVGLVPNGQVGVHRTSDRTIQFFGQYNVLRQQAGAPLEVAALVSIDGTNNFRDSYSPAIGAVISRVIGDRAALYVEPIWVNNSNPSPSQLVDDNNTLMVGVGGRLRIRPTVYIVAEVAPRLSGYGPGAPQGSFAIEKRAGGHAFQLNFSNNSGTTLGQIARGGANGDDWYLGFNISRKFF